MGKDNAFEVISPIKRMLLNVFITVEIVSLASHTQRFRILDDMKA